MARRTPLLGGAAPRQPNWRVRAVAASMLLAAVALAALALQTAPSVLLGSASAPASGEITVYDEINTQLATPAKRVLRTTCNARVLNCVYTVPYPS